MRTLESVVRRLDASSTRRLFHRTEAGPTRALRPTRGGVQQRSEVARIMCFMSAVSNRSVQHSRLCGGLPPTRYRQRQSKAEAWLRSARTQLQRAQLTRVSPRFAQGEGRERLASGRLACSTNIVWKTGARAASPPRLEPFDHASEWNSDAPAPPTRGSHLQQRGGSFASPAHEAPRIDEVAQSAGTGPRSARCRRPHDEVFCPV